MTPKRHESSSVWPRPVTFGLLAAVVGSAFVAGQASADPWSTFPTGNGWANPSGNKAFHSWDFGRVGCGTGHYFGGIAHLGTDSQSNNVGDPVHAIADGTVAQVVNPWDHGAAVGIEHRASDASRFVALYGHVVPRVKPGDRVRRGQVIAKIHEYDADPATPGYEPAQHLHLGIRPLRGGERGSAVALRGRTLCATYDAYGLVEPIAFLRARKPGSAGSSPRGKLDRVRGLQGNRIRVQGWAFDPDNAAKPVKVVAWIDGRPGQKGARRVDLGYATLKRGDVERAFRKKFPGVGNRHGFDRTIDKVSPGSHTVRVYAVNRFKGGGLARLGGRTIRVPKPPTGRWIAYDTTLGIHLVRPDGSQRRMLVNQRGARSPSWSRDGKWVAFEYRPDKFGNITSSTTVHVVRADGRLRRKIARGHTPAWSLDGREVYYLPRNLDRTAGVVLAVNVKTGKIRRTKFVTTARSHDGSQMAHFGGGPCPPPQQPGYENICDAPFWLHIVSTRDGREQTIRVPRRSADPLPLSWSPSGEVLYNCEGAAASRWRDLCAYDTVRRRFTHFRGPSQTAEMAGSFSPDGSQIAVAALEGLYVRPRSRNGVRWLVRNPAVIADPVAGRSNSPFSPAWQP